MTVSRRALYLTVFFAGLATLGLEFTASRLLEGTFGSSNLVWASVIGLILIYLTAGYFLGGRWADRSPYPTTLYRILAWASLTAGVASLIARPVLRFAANAFDALQIGILVGSFAAVLILFSVPVTLLGTVSPFALRLALDDPAHAGRVAGTLSAVSTLGSFIGTFLPVLVMIPVLGTSATFLTFSALLMAVALSGLALAAGWRGLRSVAWMALALLLLAVWQLGRPIKASAGQIYERESAYNYIQVIQEGDYRYLRLNEGQGVHSVWHPTQLDFGGPWEQFLAAPFFNPDPVAPSSVKSMAVIGLAAGTVARQATAVFGPIPIDGYEIDPAIIEVGREYFGLDALPNVRTLAQDGRWGLEQSPRQYDLIVIDAYRPPYIPWHLTTQEFFAIVHDHLSPTGVLAINIGRAPQDRRLIDGLAATIGTLFPSLYVMDLPDTFNSILYATVQPTELEMLYRNYLYLNTLPEVNPLLLAVIQRAIVYGQPPPDRSQVAVFTDDHAPIEWITNGLVLNYLLGGELENLQ